MLAPAHREVAGRYVLLERVGAGGSGTVWCAWDRLRETPVAVKQLADPDGDALARFLRERSVRLAHPHVLTPSGWAAEDDTVVLVMELVRGGSAADLLARHGPLPEGYVAHLLAQLLDALAHAHAHGVVHRDLKPANLLLEPTGIGTPYLRLADFGVAGLVDAGSRPRGIVGTDGYLDPTQAAGARPHPTQDVYAAARVALRLLAGARGADWQELSAAAPRLAGLLPAMVAHDPAHRPTAAEAAEALREQRIALRGPDRAAPPPDVPDLLPAHPLPGTPDRESVLPARRRSLPWWVRRPAGRARTAPGGS